MPRYISLHTLACLTRQGAEHLTMRLAAADRVTMRRVQINMIEGKMLVEFEAADRDTLEKIVSLVQTHERSSLAIGRDHTERRGIVHRGEKNGGLRS